MRAARRQAAVASAVAALLLVPAPTHAAASLAPRWAAIDRLPDGDRGLAVAWMANSYECQRAKQDCAASWSLEAALVPLGRSGRDVLAMRTYSHGTCGAYELAILGPRQRDGRRQDRVTEPTLFEACGEELAIQRRTGTLPDLVTDVFVERFGPRGPALEKTVWRWTGHAYVAVRRSRVYAKITR